MNKISTLLVATSVGIVLGAVGVYLSTALNADTDQQSSNTNQPLYWVAPMDPNFKRDQPGKSPMGMDLVPVYQDDVADDSPGTVKIDPVTIHNLGVKTTTVKMLMPKLSVRTSGSVSFAEDAIEHIHPRVEGWVESLAVRSKGEYVHAGQALYSLYSPDLVNAQEELLIALTQGNTSLINAAKSRLAALNAPPSLLKKITDTRTIERTITFNAPQSGYVNELNIQTGFYVKPSTTMLSIANMDKVWVLADVLASDLSKLAVGQDAVIVSDYFPSTQINAKLAYIYPTLDSVTRTGKARFVMQNPDLMLKPNMFTTVHINTYLSDEQSQVSVIAVPQQAIIRTGDTNRVVLALGEGKYKSINITLGRVFDDMIEVTDGLQEGDLIVTSAQFLIDSESSISSDFMRMQPESLAAEDELSMSAWTHATVNEVMPDEQMLNITHGPLEAFDMMGMSMNFMLADDIDISQFAEGMQIHVEIVKAPSGMFMVNTVHFMDNSSNTDEHGEH